MPDGSLKWEVPDQNSGIIPNWLTQHVSGPYFAEREQPVFYYLGGQHSEYGYYWMQICSGPLNVLSEDCMDEVNVWIPEHL